MAEQRMRAKRPEESWQDYVVATGQVEDPAHPEYQRGLGAKDPGGAGRPKGPGPQGPASPEDPNRSGPGVGEGGPDHVTVPEPTPQDQGRKESPLEPRTPHPADPQAGPVPRRSGESEADYAARTRTGRRGTP